MRLSAVIGNATLLLFAATGFGAQPTATGLQHLKFTDYHPLSASEIVLARLGLTNQTASGRRMVTYNVASEGFTAHVPRDYNAKVAQGLLVWTGVSPFAESWLDVLSRHRLLLVFADAAIGHPSPYGLHLDAAHNMQRRYTIDTNRVYIAGFSAGGSLAKYLICAFPDVFHGGLFLMGGYFYRSRDLGNGQREPTLETSEPGWQGPLDQIKKNTRLVIMKGGSDPEWTPQEGRSDYRALWLDGFTRVSYLEVPGLKHVHPDVRWFEKGVAALDQSAPLIPPVTSPTQDAHPLPTQIAQAQRTLATGRYYLELKPPGLSEAQQESIRKSNRTKARKYLEHVLAEYPATPAATTARGLLASLDR